jgi:DNA-binding response OmpR family regulator
MSKRNQNAGLVLIVDDNRMVAESIGYYLESCGYAVDFAEDGISGLHLAITNSYDIVILDLMLPGLNGLDVCRKLRNEARNSTPLLMLTGRSTLEDKVLGLEAGADDYLVKPFELRELSARVNALIRRQRRQVSLDRLVVGDLILDKATLRITRSGRELAVSPLGLRLLEILMRESPRVVARREIEREIWGDALPDSDTLRSHMYNLRRIIDKPFARPLLQTVTSAGYRLADFGVEVASDAA